MTWIIYKADRNNAINVSLCNSIHLNDKSVLLYNSDDVISLKYDTNEEAKQAYGYILEGIRNKTELIHI